MVSEVSPAYSIDALLHADNDVDVLSREPFVEWVSTVPRAGPRRLPDTARVLRAPKIRTDTTDQGSHPRFTGCLPVHLLPGLPKMGPASGDPGRTKSEVRRRR